MQNKVIHISEENKAFFKALWKLFSVFFSLFWGVGSILIALANVLTGNAADENCILGSPLEHILINISNESLLTFLNRKHIL